MERFNEGIVALNLFLLGGIIWVVFEFWEGFKIVFGILALFLIFIIIKEMWSNSVGESDDADEGTDY